MNQGRKVLLVGSGGREHALALKLLGSASVSEVVVVPGNPGMTRLPSDLSGKTLRVASGDAFSVVRAEAPDLVVIGPEGPLCAGLADEVRALGIPCYGPSRRAAELEGSKAFMKSFCKRHNIPTAREVVVTRADEVKTAVATFAEPPVIKADGLCAGKGVVVATSFEEAEEAAISMLSGEWFGDAGKTVVIEERLYGDEASVHAICDGQRAFILPVAQDHKRIFDGDLGPNTGGMGTYAPAPLVTPALMNVIERTCVQPVLDGMRTDGIPFIGTLFVGIMVSPTGEPKVLEFNVRFGDPETQVVLSLLEGDFAEVLYSAALGDLGELSLAISDESAVCVVLAARGYPEAPEVGDRIRGLEAALALPNVRVFQAGTKLDQGELVTAGGRVLGVTARARTLVAARDLAYQATELIHFEGMQYRRDIAHRALGKKD
jgi:phosphoribosylamine---glycine ligase